MKATPRALLGLLASIALPACGGSQNATLPQGVREQSRVYRTSGSSGSRSSLLYAAKGTKVHVFTYPDGKYVAAFSPPYAKTINGICSDANGNVFIVIGRGNLTGLIYEYAHGTTSPSATVPLGGWDGLLESCAAETSDPELVVAGTDGGHNPGIILWNTPTSQPTWVGGSDSITGINGVTFMNDKNIFAWCPGSFLPLVLFNYTNRGYWSTQSVNFFGKYGHFIQWDGSELALLTRSSRLKEKTRIQQIKVISGQGAVTGTTKFKGLGKSGTAFALYGSSVVLSINSGKSPSIGIYRYPQGGNPVEVIHGYSADSLTVSVVPSR